MNEPHNTLVSLRQGRPDLPVRPMPHGRAGRLPVPLPDPFAPTL